MAVRKPQGGDPEVLSVPLEQSESEAAVETSEVVERMSRVPREDTVSSIAEPLVEEPEPPVASRTRQQAGKSILKPSNYAMATKLDKRTEKDPVKLAAIKAAEVEEIKQIFEDLEAVHEEDIEGKEHEYHMFTVDKFLVDGNFDKCKRSSGSIWQRTRSGDVPGQILFYSHRSLYICVPRDSSI